ncbi:type I-F CRISPR-associated protein Csy3 [Sulfuriflexus sp.]|uniref:type I-F CRISPR-associated protein Csy3 n=1 Tax=Sulfuriflexus sp. TaxID=2015443 RepID=UPI0028CDEE7B|nr:type I-F CRISPR-associated protein Csy3 [Sulfuriflexus sp.]MDT8403255.1 type I-F CRISPR-associated protein Csy3 [Sulfuriflexus sp.]
MTIDLPSMLSFEHKLETSDGLMFSGNWNEKDRKDEWKVIPITKRQNRSTQSAHGTSDEDKIKPNPVSSDSDDANLPIDKDALRVSFSLRVIGNLGKPFGCNDPGFESAIVAKIGEFKESNSVGELAYRYAYNIANGRFLWRNRVGADEISIHVTAGNDQTLIFNAYDFSLSDFDKNKELADLNTLVAIIETGLKGDGESFVLINVDAYVKFGVLQHVFPSQEMNMNVKGKSLFQLDGCAAMHNVKIGNALRTIDTWYPRYAEEKQPIAIEPFGAVTQRGDAYRKNKKEGDLYSLMLDWVNDKDITDNQKSYVTANLIRGGVFSKKSDKKG